MPMNGPVTPKQQDDIDLVNARRHPHAPFNAAVRLKASKVPRRAPQPENGRSPHARDESSTRTHGFLPRAYADVARHE